MYKKINNYKKFTQDYLQINKGVNLLNLGKTLRETESIILGPINNIKGAYWISSNSSFI